MRAAVAIGDINTVVSPESSGTITVTKVEAQTGGDNKVTFTATPAGGYSISKTDIIVQPVTDPSQTRAPGIASELEVMDGSSTNEFYFILPAKYDGAIVTANFTSTTALEIDDLSGIISPFGNYKFSSNFTASGTPTDGIGTAANPFRGKLEGYIDPTTGEIKTISLSSPLFDYVRDATIKNIVVTGTINGSGNVGAIAGNALGDTRIYNCGVLATAAEYDTDGNLTGFSGSSVSGDDYVGGIVGFLDGTSRVINCFSYANVIGGSFRGGIVGYNNVATTSSNLKTMVMNCMFYGNITGGSIAPIYNGEIITNRSDQNGVSNFNYFWADAAYVKNKAIGTYNCALMTETRFLQRFEFYRHLLNSHRELAAWWATGDYRKKSEMAKWVLEPSQIGSDHPFPILKAHGYYPSVVNVDAENATTQMERNKGGKLGTLTVNIRMGDGEVYTHPGTGDNEAKITTAKLTLNITDKDPDHFNFNYYKVQLPYYNDVGTKNYTGNRVVTGWKIVSIDKTTGSLTTGEDATATVTTENGETTVTLSTPYNFADRNSTAKDLYSSTNKRVFNQGAYWDVPEGVEEITIEPYWAKAAYLADAYLDIVYDKDMADASNVPNVGGGQIYTNNTNYNIAGGNQKVYTSVGNARNALDKSTERTVYDCAIVLVGNAHNIGISSGDADRFYTIMSADFDHDNEPDYSYILRFNSRNKVHPVRVDFLNVPGLGMAQKSTGGEGSYNFGIMNFMSWFEATNTSLFRITQLEYEHKDRGAMPIILQGGVFEQWVSAQSQGNGNRTTYFHVGGNVWFKEFHLGCHQDRTDISTKHPPVSVTGGDFDEFYLTGFYSTSTTIYDDNAECYINGGRFGIVAGTGMEGLGSSTTKGNIVWQIDNADITEFYGGGINATKPAIGNITTVISNSHVDSFCGGPKFGDMAANKSVVTKAISCTFGKYFGAGYGGNSYSRFAPKNYNDVQNVNWNNWIAGTSYPDGGNYGGYKLEYNSGRGGVATQFDYQFIPMSGNVTNVARLFIDYVSFSLATTHNVNSILNGCTINGNFYGGGSLGKVDGDVTSTLTNCIVKGNVFGAGYSASKPTVEVMPTSGFITEPSYDTKTGSFTNGVLPSKTTATPTTTYTWKPKDGDKYIDTGKSELYTSVDLSESNLGSVSGAVTLTITTEGTNGKTVIGTVGNTDTGNVYGGGDESYVNNSTTPADASTTVTLSGNTEVLGSVFGGGNKGLVSGSTTVNIEN